MADLWTTTHEAKVLCSVFILVPLWSRMSSDGNPLGLYHCEVTSEELSGKLKMSTECFPVDHTCCPLKANSTVCKYELPQY